VIDNDFIRKHLWRRSGLSATLSPLAALNAIYQKHRRQQALGNQFQPPCAVISIGNLCSGGSGKTPFTIFLARLLHKQGYRVGVSHRGYKGAFEHYPALISSGEGLLHPPHRCGDEAALIASRLPGIPVVAGRQRKAAISLLLAAFPDLQLVIMDDGFQHLKVARQLDIVCFDGEVGIGNGMLLPAGYLREPLSALSRDNILVINHKQEGGSNPELERMLADYSDHLVNCHYHYSAWVESSGQGHRLPYPRGKSCLLVSGIAHPGSFEAAVRALGVIWLHHFAFGDHYSYADENELDRIATLAEKYRVEHILCTEKDMMKLCRHKRLENMLLALQITLRCKNERELLKWVEDGIRGVVAS